MRHLVFLLLLLCIFSTTTFSQNSEDCVDAHILAPLPTLLSNVPDFTLDSILGSGSESLEWFSDNQDKCGSERTFISNSNDKQFWFVFSATTSGRLEFMITPEDNATTYDFALWKGGCPKDTICSELVYCAWGAGNPDCGADYLPTGVSPNPLGTFSIPLNLTTYLDTIELVQGINYYLLIQNTDESNYILCPRPSDSLGFTIEFDGTATIGPEIIHQPPVAITPLPVADTLYVCEGDIQIFEVTEVPNASGYDWVSESTLTDATISTTNLVGNNISVQFGQISGQICMEMTCPIQSLICWEVQVDRMPDLEAVSFPNISCEPVDLASRFQDNANASAPVSFHTSQAEATAGTNPIASSIVNVSGSYWARKATPNGCMDIVEMDILVEDVAISVVDTFRVCNQLFLDLKSEFPIQNLNGNSGDLVYLFYKKEQDALNKMNPLTPPLLDLTLPNVNGTYWIRAENQSGGPCFDIQSFEFILDTAPEIAAIPNQEFCGNDCFQLSDLPITNLSGQPLTGLTLTFYNQQTDAQTGNINNQITREICASGDYWVRVESSASCFEVAPFRLDFHPAPDIDDLMIAIDCQFGCINLANLTLTEKNGLDPAILQNDYFTTQIDAEDPSASPLTGLNICQPEVIWVRVINTDNNCFDVAQLNITGIQLSEATLSGDQTICAGEEVTLDLDITGNAPFDITYSDGINTFDTVATSNSLSIALSPDSTTTYSLVSVSDAMCVGNVSGQATITVNNGPIIDNLSYNCNPTATEYELSFDIIGNSTYQVQNIAGTLTGNSFLSDFIPSGTNLSFQITSNDGCQAYNQNIVFSCDCNSVVDAMDLQPLHVCDREAAIATYLGPSEENREKEDFRYFVLHDRPDTIIGTVINFSNVPIFTFDANITTHGTTYYISAVVTKESTPGMPILDNNTNPCIAVSEGTPVTFYAVPEVSLTLSSPTICQGEPLNLTFNMQGVGPYDVLFYDGEKVAQLVGIPDGHTINVSPAFSTNFYVQSINQSGVANCIDMPIIGNHEVEIIVFDPPIISNLQQHCNELGTKLIITFEVNGGDPSSYIINGLTGNLKGNEFISDSIDVNTPYTIAVSDNNNCPTSTLIGITECLCTPDIAVNILTIQSVTCRGEKDGILMAEPVNGAAPYSYFWSSGATTQQVTNIPPGQTFVTMTDVNGCEVTNTITLIEPTSVTATSSKLEPSCYGSRDGTILIVQVEGGIGNYSFSFDGGQFQTDGIKDGFSAGVYPIVARDENGCEWTGEAILQNPPELAVSLGGDVVLDLGKSYTLTPQVNQDINGILWESTDTSLCMNCLNPIIYPTKSGPYKVTISNIAGCIDSDEIRIQVKNDQRVFVPNTFSPNDDGTNDLLHPFSSSEVRDIAMFRIFNRWGELIYEKKDMDTLSNLEGWNGETMEGRDAPPGVYLYYVEATFKDGSNEVLSGDVSLVR